METLADLYLSLCTDLRLSPNTYICHVLKETESCSSNIYLKLSGNDRVKPVSRLTDNDVLALSKMLRKNLTITALDLRYNWISDEGTTHLADLLQENGTLLELNLMCNNIEAAGAERIARSLQHNVNLKKLRMTGNKIGNRGAMQFASMLKINRTLEELDMTDCDLVSYEPTVEKWRKCKTPQEWSTNKDHSTYKGTQSLIAFAIVLNDNRSIRSINVSRPLLFSLQEEPTVHMARMLVVNQTLSELHMGKHGMTDCGVERLCEALMLNHTLRYLDLCCNKITRDGAKCLARVLKQHDSLQILDLSSNRIEDEGAVWLSEALAMSRCKLRALAIQRNNIATDGLVSLAKALHANPHLTHIYIWGNKLEDPVCAAFSQLITNGRLLKEHTDATPYEVDGRFYLAEASHGLHRHYYWTPSYGEDGDPASNAALALKTSDYLAL